MPKLLARKLHSYTEHTYMLYELLRSQALRIRRLSKTEQDCLDLITFAGVLVL